MLETIHTQGLAYYAQNFFFKFSNKRFALQKKRVNIHPTEFRKIDFAALEVNGSAGLFLNPLDEGFSKEFKIYGFREPLNTFAIFNYIAKKHPAVLDIGGNIGYFPLVELEAGAQQVIAVEPVASTFSFLAKSLEGRKKAKNFQMAISGEAGFLKLYVSTHRNVTSSSKQLIANAGQTVLKEITIKADNLKGMVDKYPVNMIRMDVEGHEYQILADPIPDQINAINIELHAMPPYTKTMATELVKRLYGQNFKAAVVINEMGYGFYSLVHSFGLKAAYKIASSMLTHVTTCPNMQTNPSFQELVNHIPNIGTVHLLLER